MKATCLRSLRKIPPDGHHYVLCIISIYNPNPSALSWKKSGYLGPHPVSQNKTKSNRIIALTMSYHRQGAVKVASSKRAQTPVALHQLVASLVSHAAR